MKLVEFRAVNARYKQARVAFDNAQAAYEAARVVLQDAAEAMEATTADFVEDGLDP